MAHLHRTGAALWQVAQWQLSAEVIACLCPLRAWTTTAPSPLAASLWQEQANSLLPLPLLLPSRSCPLTHAHPPVLTPLSLALLLLQNYVLPVSGPMTQELWIETAPERAVSWKSAIFNNLIYEVQKYHMKTAGAATVWLPWFWLWA